MVCSNGTIILNRQEVTLTATIDSYELIQKLLDNNGYYSDDPQVAVVGEYHSIIAGHKVWFILYRNELHRLSEYLSFQDAKVIRMFEED